jgi:hypothetical protein
MIEADIGVIQTSTYIAMFGANIRICRVVDLGWQLGRVFLAFLNPLRRQPDPALTANVRLAIPRYRS